MTVDPELIQRIVIAYVNARPKNTWHSYWKEYAREGRLSRWAYENAVEEIQYIGADVTGP